MWALNRTREIFKLMDELAKGEKSGEENGWLSSADVKASFKEKIDEE